MMKAHRSCTRLALLVLLCRMLLSGSAGAQCAGDAQRPEATEPGR